MLVVVENNQKRVGRPGTKIRLIECAGDESSDQVFATNPRRGLRERYQKQTNKFIGYEIGKGKKNSLSKAVAREARPFTKKYEKKMPADSN